MRRYRPKWYESYKWDYALGLIKNYGSLVNELHELESERLGYQRPQEMIAHSSEISDPTYRQAFPGEKTAYESALAKRVEAVEQSFMKLDEMEQNFLKANIIDGFTYEQLIRQGYPFSTRTMARIKSRLIRGIIERLNL